MKRKRYSCDGGTICIGTIEARACYTNNYGDGTHTVTVYSKNDCFNGDGWEFKGSVEGQNIIVFDYDCLTDEDIKNENHVLFKLSGRCGVFAKDGNIVLNQWD